MTLAAEEPALGGVRYSRNGQTPRPPDPNQLEKLIVDMGMGIHKTLLVTPAMEARVFDHVWELAEIAELAI